MRNSLKEAGQRFSCSLTPRQVRIQQLSDRLVAAQRPLRVLTAVQWAPEIEHAFFAAGCRELPPVSRASYELRPLPFDSDCKRHELLELERDINRQLGHANACSQMMVRRCREYRQVADLLASRGTPAFAALSAELFGASTWQLDDGNFSLASLASLVKQAVRALEEGSVSLPNRGHESPRSPDTYNAVQAAAVLDRRLRAYFGEEARCRLELAPQLLAEAQASGCTVRLRADATYSAQDIRLLEVHEGWVHIATTFNGRAQKYATFLAKSSPAATVTQEGLAVLTEILAGTTHPARLRRLANRIEAVAMAEAGADFLDVYGFFLEEEGEPRASYHQAQRIFRGSLPTGCGPFTKDLSYLKGLLSLLHFLNQAARNGNAGWLALLFCGKMALADLPMAVQLVEEGTLEEPAFVPPFFTAGPVLDLWAELAGSLSTATQFRFA